MRRILKIKMAELPKDDVFGMLGFFIKIRVMANEFAKRQIPVAA
jgi:hypothetical protein